MEYYLYMVIFALFGICVGSFSNVLIHRLPRGESINFPASHCPKCGTPLKFYHNVPLFSWLFLGGKCAFCKEKISLQYPLVEISGGILAVLALWICDFDIRSGAFLGLAFILMLVLSVIDFKFHAVPESILILSYILVLASLYRGDIGEFWDNVKISLVFAGGIVMVKSLVSVWINRHNNSEIVEAMGDADTIVIASIGALLGGNLGLVCIFVAAILQLVFHFILKILNKGDEAPFIPALFGALLICLVFGDQISSLIDAYLHYAGLA